MLLFAQKDRNKERNKESFEKCIIDFLKLNSKFLKTI